MKAITVDTLRKSHPDLLAKLQRPVNGQGGFQSLLRQLQDAFGIVPRIDTGERSKAVVATGINRTATVQAVRATADNGTSSDLTAKVREIKAAIQAERDAAAAKLAEAQAALAQLNGETSEPEPDDEPVTAVHTPRKSRKRSNAMRRAWAALTPKQRAARVKAMRNGRSK